MMQQREVTDSHNTTWTCVQAYAGVETAATAEAVERSATNQGGVTVVCTPRGGAQTVRLELASDWQQNLSDEELQQAIAAAR
ncbi:hypothetical protein MUN84_12525 [Hymenobacter sp. 5516J-16]|uniref:Uncharacterized protein n=1 Tax=Hymenobacter sublimis TaxID=2933777 RepID=A0ABY4J8Q2_9BACT|nr:MULTISPECIES: hypothetical protein [Hymenobacter]UOQ75517.1 hypothetical protein MUN84_12525 [Hymenobacter sp. 5516J-16]UPL49194.1 hypothetical protein MWH26_18705 [Hymenobacter sublimis]